LDATERRCFLRDLDGLPNTVIVLSKHAADLPRDRKGPHEIDGVAGLAEVRIGEAE